MFALSYRSTLAASSTERAAYQVPLDYTLSSGPSLDAPQDVASLARYRALAPRRRRLAGPASDRRGRRERARPATPTVLGVPAAAFPLLHGWRSDFSSDGAGRRSAVCCGRRSRSRSRAPSSRETATRLELPAVLERPDAPAGARRADALAATRTSCAPSSRPEARELLTAAVPPADRGGKIVALRLDLPSAVQRSSAHQQAEGRNGGRRRSPGRCGSEQLVAVTGSGRVPVTAFRGWDGQRRHHGHARRRRRPCRLRDRHLGDGAASPPSAVRLTGASGDREPGRRARRGPGRRAPARLRRRCRRGPARGRRPALPDHRGRRRQLRRRRRGLARGGARRRRPPDLDPRRALALDAAGPVRARRRRARAAAVRDAPRSTRAVPSRRRYRDEPLARGIVVSLIAAAVAAVGARARGPRAGHARVRPRRGRQPVRPRDAGGRAARAARVRALARTRRDGPRARGRHPPRSGDGGGDRTPARPRRHAHAARSAAPAGDPVARPSARRRRSSRSWPLRSSRSCSASPSARRRRAAAPPGRAGHDRVSPLELRDVFRIHETAEGGAVALQGLSLGRAPGRALRRPRAERVGQEHAAAHRGRLRPALGRHRAHARGRPRPAPGAPRRRVSRPPARVPRPALRALALPRAHLRRERRAAAPARRLGGGAAPAARARAARARGARRPRRRPPVDALRRRAAAGRRLRLARAPSRDPVRGRAGGRARREDRRLRLRTSRRARRGAGCDARRREPRRPGDRARRPRRPRARRTDQRRGAAWRGDQARGRARRLGAAARGGATADRHRGARGLGGPRARGGALRRRRSGRRPGAHAGASGRTARSPSRCAASTSATGSGRC